MRTVREGGINLKKIDSNYTITDFNSYLFHEGRNYEAYKILGSHVVTEENKSGIRFSTWAPNAKEIWIVGDFNNFSINKKYKLEKVTEGGIWSIFIADIEIGTKYKYAIKGVDNKVVYKADPYAISSELRPNSASIVYKTERFNWIDKKWRDKKIKSNIYKSPINIYEVHLGSWKTKEGEFLTYEELSEELPEYVSKMGYTYVEIMPLVEHPLDASWGYQGVGFYSLTSRYGTIEGFKKLVQALHLKNIGVILDWAPGHFCKDAHGLYKFDGGPTYEYEEEWKAENKGWGTANFDLGRPEVKSFLISNALYWIKEFHIDGLRVDAVSNILYLNYGRNDGEWMPNKDGGSGNLEGIQFVKDLNTAVFKECNNVLMIAEESTSWPNVCMDIENGGLGFNFKWDMGWMNDTLEYIEMNPVYRKYHHNNLTFSMMYNYSENFILPLSHDEVVHGKKSMVDKMFGDYWNKFAGLRLLLAYMIGHPGKKLTFMGAEFGQFIEWREYEELEWKLIDNYPMHKDTQNYVMDLNNFYKKNRALWELDYDTNGFTWIDADNNDQSILVFMRKGKHKDDTLIFICNFTPVVYYDFRIGVPYLTDYKEVLNSDDSIYGGSGQILGDVILVAENERYHNQKYSIKVKVPPMATLVIGIKRERKEKVDESIISSI
ncbi:1,4-alpha-glucan branching protein GlgB [Clostridium paraputrificum]|uniref:1,4-alpha-glucan branching protein GlgB n=1 Tax=Clostridium paraputrificum TaxID=29363 RepID=UPI003D325236